MICTALVAGCAENGSRTTAPDRSGPVSAAPQTKPLPEKIMEPSHGGKNEATIELPKSLLDPAVTNLAERLGVAERDIRIVRAIPVVWNDGAMGCPQPGRAYTQALVPGYWAVLEHGGRYYSYHAGRNQVFRLCENARPDPVAAPPGGRYDDTV